MRSHFTAILSFVCLVLAGMISAAPHGQQHMRRGQQALQVLSYDPSAGQASLTVACPECAAARPRNLGFEFAIQPSRASELTHFSVNNVELNADLHTEDSWYTVRAVTVQDDLNEIHRANISITATRLNDALSHTGIERLNLLFDVLSFDGMILPQPRPGFSIVVAPMSPFLIERIQAAPGGVTVGTKKASSLLSIPEKDENSYDLAADAASLLLLEAQAEDIRAQIAAKKQAISAHLKDHRNSVPLKHLLDECDSLLCTARVIAQRICDKMGVDTEPSYGYAKFGGGADQKAMSTDDATSNRTAPQREQANLKLMLSKNTTSEEYNFVDLINPTNPFIRALEIVCSVLGLTALYSLVRSTCASARTKVDRAAAQEERRTARAYRRAARRAAMRKRWDAFVDAINCFGKREEPRTADYEEKRALILQDAFLEQLEDVDAAEKGQTMEAEIRELRYAHEIVAGLVQVDERRQNLTHYRHDPPPPLVPIPRSRASTQTLPPYISDAESLPSYRSRPVTLAGSNSSVMTTSPSVSDDEDFSTDLGSSTLHTRYTPGSSIIDTSPRVSQDTLRTRLSKSTQTRLSMDQKHG